MNWTRPRAVWAVFGLCLLVLVVVMGWMTHRTLGLEEERRLAEADRDLHERIRLALWRMDSAANALVFAESARAPHQFKAFHATDQAYTNTYQLVKKGQILAPSPLLSSVPEYASLYFQVDGEGTFTSPQVPLGNSRDLAEQNYMSSEAIEAAAALLGATSEHLSEETLSTLAAGVTAPMPSGPFDPTWTDENSKMAGEFQSRSRTVSQSNLWSNASGAKILTSNKLALEQAASAGVNLTRPDAAKPFRGIWRGGELFLARTAILDGRDVVQGVWLKADVIRKLLLFELRDLLPRSSLSPALDQPSPGRPVDPEALEALARSLVALPFNLEPGESAGAAVSTWSPVKRSLAIAWVCVLAVAAAGGSLIAGIVGLSERRAAFVSAVTHEMRTPLTTFRLYSEMLSDGMVRDPERKSEYLTTLTSEADRLSHLVENVLAYARLEKGRTQTRAESIFLHSLIERVRPRLEQRAAQDDFEFRVEMDRDRDERMSSVRVRLDVTAVEQILFNLVDNACKYGRPSDGARIIHLEADTEGPLALLRIRDHGCGISKSEEKRLFRPFEKSADEAAHTAPGVGLGLALCRKMSRALGGDLRLCEESSEGACFVLSLPASAACS